MSSSQLFTLGVSAILFAISMLSSPTAQEPRRVEVNTDDVRAVYANFSRVTGTPEEVIVDFGLNTQANGVVKSPVRVDSRVVVNFYTAKRLMTALQLTIERHEKAFGPIEVDVRKRVLKPTSAPANSNPVEEDAAAVVSSAAR